jgi:hypothetical protein
MLNLNFNIVECQRRTIAPVLITPIEYMIIGGGGGENPLLGGIMNMMPMFTSMMMGSFTSKPKDNTDDKVVITDENDEDSLIESTINDLSTEDTSSEDSSECKDGVCKVNLEELSESNNESNSNE